MTRGARLLLFALPLLWACRPTVDPQAVARQVLDGDLSGAAAVLARRAPDPSLDALEADAARWQVISAERKVLARSSREVLRSNIDQEIRDGDLSGAAGHLAAAIAAWPRDPGMLQLAQDLGEAAKVAPVDTSVAAWEALARILADDPARAAKWQAQAVVVALARDYAPDRLAQTRAAWRGVTRAGAVGLLERLDGAYVDAPDWAAVSRAARARLERLVRTPGVLTAWPKVKDLQWPDARARDVAGAVADLDACLAAAAGAHLPAEVVTAEWVHGGLDSLDPWTRVVWPSQIEAWQAGHAGVSVGVGLELDIDVQGAIRVARPLPDTPAWRSEVHQDDTLLDVADDKGPTGLATLPVDQRLDAAREALVGAPGSMVTLALERSGRPLSVDLKRAPVVRETVEGWKRDADNTWNPWLDADAGLAYIRIEAFRGATPDDMRALLAGLADRIQVLILDLRGNPGGDVGAAIHVADAFVAHGALARISGRVLPDTGPDVNPKTGAPLAAWNEALPGDPLEDKPVVVLVDGQTASAAEVVAGALQQLAHGVVVGAPTWGKGFAQVLHEASDGSYAMQFTNLVWTLPDGQRLAHHGQGSGGIQPQIRLSTASPGELFCTDWMRARRTALRVHADGTPMHPVGTPPRADLPPLDADPWVLAAELAARALRIERDAAHDRL